MFLMLSFCFRGIGGATVERDWKSKRMTRTEGGCMRRTTRKPVRRTRMPG